MKILVTGGAGFVGSHYVRTLLDGGYPGFGHAQVTVLDKMTYAGNLANLEPVAASPRFSFVRGDICDAALLASVVPGHDVVINFAAEPHVDRSIAGASAFRGRERDRGSGSAAGVPGCGGLAGGPGVHRRGIRQRGVGVVGRGRAARAELAVLRGEGRR